MTEPPIEYLPRDGARIALYRDRPKSSGREAGVLFCPGFHSDMMGAKATALAAHLAERGVDCTRFDYQGHGQSSGAFVDGTIGLWRDDALAVLDHATEGPQLIVGSSMGAWMAMLLAAARPDRVRALLLLAPAPDFPTELMLPSMPEAARHALARDGVWRRPSAYDDAGYEITSRLIDDSRAHTVLDRDPIPFAGPVRIIHGSEDADVPVSHALRVPAAIASEDVVLEIVKGADHRLSTPQDIALMLRRVDNLLAE